MSGSIITLKVASKHAQTKASAASRAACAWAWDSVVPAAAGMPVKLNYQTLQQQDSR
jgi:hypothetical protein